VSFTKSVGKPTFSSMRYHTLILVYICIFTFLVKAEPPKGFTALFNGKNLDGWKAKPNGWAVENGILTRKPKSGYIWTEEAYGDFVLDVEVKVSQRCNSGIFFRTDPKNAVQGGFEIQVMDTTGKKKLGKHDNGAFYDALAPSANPAKPLGEWNRFVITCKGPNISVSINGTEVVRVDLDKWTTGNKNPDGSRNKFKTALKDLPRKGHIGFQDHGQDVWYRNIYLKSLN